MLLVERERDWLEIRRVSRRQVCEAFVSLVVFQEVERAIEVRRGRRDAIAAGCFGD